MSENFDDTIESIFEGRAILITGAGASWGAKNTQGQDMPSGYKLASSLYTACKLPEGNDLRDAADTYIEQYGKAKLIKKIREVLTIGSVAQWHEVLYSQKWRTIYTTNYDEIPIIAAQKAGIDLFPITIDMSFKENVSVKNKCIYINGYINNLRNETLDSQFKLNSSSYQSSENISNSQWGSLLNDDIESAKYIFIVGLSLEYDLDLERILKFSNDYSSKIIIITSSPKSLSSGGDLSEYAKKIRKLKRFGSVYEIGVSGFAEKILSRQDKYVVSNKTTNYLYTCFEQYMDTQEQLIAPSNETVFNYYMSGTFNDKLLYKKNNKFTSLIERKQVKEILDLIIKNKKIIFLHSYLGNGKSGIIHLLKKQVIDIGIHVFEFVKFYSAVLADDIDHLSSLDGKKVVIIENFSLHKHILEKFSVTSCKDLTLILTARTGLIESVYHEICDMFQIKDDEAFIIDANKLNNDELINIDNIFERYGFWGRYSDRNRSERLKILRKVGKGNSALQSILLIVLESETISKEIDKVVDTIRKYSEKYFEIIVLALSSRIMNLELSAHDINEIVDVNIMRDIKFTSNEFVRELIVFGESKFDFRAVSSVVANALLHKTASAQTIIAVLHKAAAFSIKYCENKKYENILRYIISFSLISTFVEGFREKEIFMEQYYEKLSSLPYFSKNHFFWLQYAMACIGIAKYTSNNTYYQMAQRYINTAYGLASKISNFVPFQINNQQARLLLEIIESNFSNNIKSDFMKAHNLLKTPITSRKDNPISVIKVFKFYIKDSFIKQFNSKDLKKLLSDYCGEGYNIVSNLCKRLPEQERYQFNSLKTKLMQVKFDLLHD